MRKISIILALISILVIIASCTNVQLPDPVYECSDSSLIGDVDGDGTIDNSDAQVVLEMIAGSIDLPENTCCVDVDGNDLVQEYDASLILQISEGTRTPLGTCAGGCFVPPCAAPPDGCNYVEPYEDATGCPICGTLVCNEVNCPDIPCANIYPSPGCEMQVFVDSNGCQQCPVEVC